MKEKFTLLTFRLRLILIPLLSYRVSNDIIVFFVKSFKAKPERKALNCWFLAIVKFSGAFHKAE